MKRIPSPRSLARALVLAACAFAASAAFPALAQTQACGPYRVSFYEFGSLYYKDATGQWVGIDKDVVDEVARRSGCELKGEHDSRVRTWARLAEGTLDMSVSGIPTPERQVFADFALYANTRNYLIVDTALAGRIKSLADFTADPELQLAVVKSFRHGSQFDQWIDVLRAQGRVQEYPDAEVVARVFAIGRVHAFLSQPITWGPLLRHNGLEDKVRKLDLVPHERVLAGLVFSRKRVAPADIERMRAALRAMRSDGTLEKIYTRHLDSATARWMLNGIEP